MDINEHLSYFLMMLCNFAAVCGIFVSREPLMVDKMKLIDRDDCDDGKCPLSLAANGMLRLVINSHIMTIA